jgi:hypothetical protein
MAAGENETEGSSSSMGSSVGGSLSLAEPVACAGSSAPLLCSDAIPREGQQSEQLCVVCHFFPLSRALLPCRHTCICAICFCKFLVKNFQILHNFVKKYGVYNLVKLTVLVFINTKFIKTKSLKFFAHLLAKDKKMFVCSRSFAFVCFRTYRRADEQTKNLVNNFSRRQHNFCLFTSFFQLN